MYRVLLTMVPPFPSREGASARAALEGAGIPLFKAEIRRAAAFSSSAYEGVPVRDYETFETEWCGRTTKQPDAICTGSMTWVI